MHLEIFTIEQAKANDIWRKSASAIPKNGIYINEKSQTY